MRIGKTIAMTMAGAVLGTASLAHAATSQPITLSDGLLSHLSSGVSDFFTPRYQADGSVYGVAWRGRGSGLATIQILPPGRYHGQSATPGACSSGWCNTAAGIAVSTFGWDGHANGAGVRLAIADSGIDLNHPEFAGRVATGACFTQCVTADNMVGGDDGVYPTDTTHGTHVAGIAAGANVGIAPGATIVPVRVLSTAGSGSGSAIDAGVVWASSPTGGNADIINLSLGGPILSAGEITAYRTAVSNGSLIVVAAGNNGTRQPAGGSPAGVALQDGIRGSMIVVGATTAGGSYGTIASFSQTPGNRCEIHSGQRYCMKDYFVVAPGQAIWSSVGDGTGTAANYAYLSGTSMATPYVSGVAALIKGQWPSLTSSQIADIIFSTTDDLGAPGTDRVYGRGAVDISKALSPVGISVVATSGTVGTTPSGGSSSSPSTPTTTPPGATNPPTTPTTSPPSDPSPAPSPSPVRGARGATTSLASGPLAVAVQNSKLLKKVVVVDSFGRDFAANLTSAVYLPTMANFEGMLWSDNFQTYKPFSGVMHTAFGTVVASGFAVKTTTPRLLSGQFRNSDYHRYGLRDFQLSAAVMPGVTLNAGYRTEMAGRINGYDATGSSAYDGLFFSASAVNSPYLSLTDGGNYLGTSVRLTDDLELHFGATALDPQRPEFEVPVFSTLEQLRGPQRLYDLRQAQATEAGLNWNFAKWGGLGLTASNTTEHNGFLGGVDSGSLSVAKSANTTAIGLTARFGFGEGWVTTFSYNEGITQLNLRPNGLVTSADTLRSRAYGVAVAKHGLFGNSDSLGLALTRPIQVYDGGVNFAAATGIDANGNLLVGREHVALASATPETDVELGYVTTFFDGALALQANAGYQMNFAGQSGTNALTVLSRAKINF